MGEHWLYIYIFFCCLVFAQAKIVEIAAKFAVRGHEMMDFMFARRPESNVTLRAYDFSTSSFEKRNESMVDPRS